ncbi:hypothetical protein PGT21_013261 [Puccinia graminis f. sp. tritici]|uniref:Uncharacterized protein n=1 Tax=Puccinia graminis f. sp. tritici TaxID=56615 RepID=A0A5B0NIT3_PUCGR|nr:hypothetical protein PGT21_013261 [Puccinia graminis f. sp. tritici]KAA1088040.1 hypothetical protein PGTUg99_022681 [Puccinia graminis f. sp. tritici]
MSHSHMLPVRPNWPFALADLLTSAASFRAPSEARLGEVLTGLEHPSDRGACVKLDPEAFGYLFCGHFPLGNTGSETPGADGVAVLLVQNFDWLLDLNSKEVDATIGVGS